MGTQMAMAYCIVNYYNCFDTNITCVWQKVLNLPACGTWLVFISDPVKCILGERHFNLLILQMDNKSFK